MNGNYLIIIVTVSVILPLALMKHLGTTSRLLMTSRGRALCSRDRHHSVCADVFLWVAVLFWSHLVNQTRVDQNTSQK